MDAKRVLIGHTPTVLPQRFTLRIFALLIAAFCVSATVYGAIFYGYGLMGVGTSNANDVYKRNWPIRNFGVVERCSKTFANVCYSVTDVIDEESNVARRVLFTNGLAEAESVVPLIPPKGMSTKNSDTRIWRVNHTTFGCQYQMGMVAAAFAVGALRPPPASAALTEATANHHAKAGGANAAAPDIIAVKSTSSVTAAADATQMALTAGVIVAQEEEAEAVMIIGLGGGNTDMFLSGRFPKMNITVHEIDPTVVELARDWFDVRESPQRRTIVGDGIEALRNASAQGELYNVVFLDACNFDTKVPCPSSEFLENSTLQHAKSILKPTGVFVVNVLPLVDECENLRKDYEQLTSHFPLCTVTHFTEESNSIFACLPYEVPAGDLTSLAAAWQKAWAVSVGALGFGDRLKSEARFEVSPTMRRFQRSRFGQAPAC